MNYLGKFDAKDAADALGLNAHGHLFTEKVHATHAPADAIIVSDAHLLFTGEFKRSGIDLILSGDDRELVLHDYFKGEKRAALSSPDGAHLTGDLVNALSGQVQYAQADGAVSANKVIGHVTKLIGTATATRNGVSIILNNGDNVEKGDVVASGSDSTLGVTFIDGTVFGLSSNARMVLNEMIYDPNGSNNSSLLSLVAGTISFVAGETAKHGDMKVDTPVATMGIRGTAVLFAVHFKLPDGSLVPDNESPPPDAKPEGEFQVLIEPDGTTGSYILFDKATLTRLAVVDTAGLQINIANGLLSQTMTPLSAEIQKLITDVFSLKFSDSSNTKSLDHFTDSIVPLVFQSFKLGGLAPAPTVPIVVDLVVTAADAPDSNSPVNVHIPIPPDVKTTNGTIIERLGVTGSAALDTTGGTIKYVDINAGDQPTASIDFKTFTYTYKDAKQQPAALNTQQINDIKAAVLEAAANPNTKVTQDPSSPLKNFGTATWQFSVADGAFDFLAKDETLTLTFNVVVDNDYAPFDQTTTVPITVTITGTNDKPVITTLQQNVNFASAGTDTSGGNLFPDTATKGTLTFTDPDLTDTHTVAVKMTSALLDGQNLSASVGQARLDAFAAALTANINVTGKDSTGTGTGTIAWTLADLEVYLADLVPDGKSLVLTYAVTVTDSQGATSTQNIVVTINGGSAKATAWIDTTPIPLNGAALWSTDANWESDKAPTISDDTVIDNNQANPGTPTFPVTVDAGASAKSLTMNDFGGTAMPKLHVNSGVTLTIAGALNLNTDTATDPVTHAPLVSSTAEAIIDNFGTISVGTAATLLKQSVLNNYGQLTLNQGGDFNDQSSIANSGVIEVVNDTLTSEVNIANSITTIVNGLPVTTPGTIKVDGGATLKLTDGAVVTSGSVTLGIQSTFDVEKGAVPLAKGTPDATLDGVTVTGTNGTSTTGSTIEIGATSVATLLLDDGTIIKNGNLTIAGGSALDVTTSGATLDGVTVTGVDGVSGSTIEIGTTTTTGTVLTLDDGTKIINGNVKLDAGNGINVTSTSGATLDGVTVTGVDGVSGSTIEVGTTTTTGTVLTLDDGAKIINGNVKLDAGNGINVTSTSGATLDGVTVTGVNGVSGSTIEVGTTTTTGTVLTLDDGAKIINGNVKLDAGNGINVTSTSGATLDGVTVTGVNGVSGSTIEVGTTTTTGTVLTLDDGTKIINGNVKLDAGNGINVTSTSGATLDGVTVTGVDGVSGSTIEVGTTTTTGTVLTLDDGAKIINGNVKLDAGNGINVTSTSGATLDGVTVTGVNGVSGSTIEVGTTTTTGTVLTLDDGTKIINGNVKLDAGNGINVTSTSGATLDGVTVTGVNGVSGSTIEVGTTTTTGTVLTLDDGAKIINGNVKLDAGNGINVTSTSGATLDGVTVTGVDGVSGSTIEVGTTVTSGTVLTLDDATIVTNGNLVIDSNNTLQIESSAGATLAGVNVSNFGAIQVDGAGGPPPPPSTTVTLVLDGGTEITGGKLIVHDPASSEEGVVEIGNGGATFNDVTVTNNNKMKIDSSVVLTLEGGTTITDGTVDDVGTISGYGAISSVITDTGAVTATGGRLTLSGINTYSGLTTIDNGAVLAPALPMHSAPTALSPTAARWISTALTTRSARWRAPAR